MWRSLVSKGRPSSGASGTNFAWIALVTASIFVSILILGAPAEAQVSQDSGTIRLAPREAPASGEAELAQQVDMNGSAEPRRGFDYDRFETRLQSLWFQRKAFLADGADEQARQQADLIQAFCHEEGIERLEGMASALLAETKRHLANGHYNRALDALALAERLDSGRAQTRFARADVLWQADGRNGEAVREWLSGLSASISDSIQNLSLFRGLAMTLVVALAAMIFLFSLVMVFRYQLPFRHEVEEVAVQRFDPRIARPIGWVALFLPVLLWISVGWSALYWLVISFRYMRRQERLVTVSLLIAAVLSVPVYRGAVAIYGLTADPVVRTTLTANDGEYDPDRIVRLRKLVDSHPDDASYRFLLAGLYKNGRFFEEAFEEYKRAIDLDPAMEQAYINVGNIFAVTGQYGEAIAHFQKALEVSPSSTLAYFNLHLTQAESFKFTEAQETLRAAREIDPEGVSKLMQRASLEERSKVIDAQLQVATVWGSALGGHSSSSGGVVSAAAGIAHPIGIASIAAILGALVWWFVGRDAEPARRCIRCGQAFCELCKSTQDGHEYCTQCVHLYVLGDGLAPETKTKKLYEVERHERWVGFARRFSSLLLPGSAQLNRGRTIFGTLLLLGWIAGWVGAMPHLLRPLDRWAAVHLKLDLLDSSVIPAVWSVSALGVLSTLLVTTVWLVGNGWVLRRNGGH